MSRLSSKGPRRKTLSWAVLATGHSFRSSAQPTAPEPRFFLYFNKSCSLRRSLAGVSPKIDRPLLRIAINLIQLCIRELEFPNRIERVVELLHITTSDKRRGYPIVPYHPPN